MTKIADGVDGFGSKDVAALVQHPALLAGVRLDGSIGQTVNTVTGNVTNQGIGTVAVPALSAAGVATVVISNTLFTAISMLFGSIKRSGSTGATTPAAGAQGAISWDVVSISAGVSATVEFRNNGSAATLATDYEFNYMICG